jgi:hypothetical protein
LALEVAENATLPRQFAEFTRYFPGMRQPRKIARIIKMGLGVYQCESGQ